MAAKDIEQHKFKKGQSGNPNGRPKLPDLKEAMAKVLGEEKDGRTALEAILAALRLKAARGDAKAAELLLKYTYRQPTQEIDLKSNGKEMRSWTVKSV
jgi:alkylation response protein AidB-like acyl-CoA dehydrogenase